MDPFRHPFAPARRSAWRRLTLGALTGLAFSIADFSAASPAGLAAADTAPPDGAPAADPAGAAPKQATPGAVHTDPATELPMAVELDNNGDNGRTPAVDSGPAPNLIATDPATRQTARRLIHDLDSPASEVANRAFGQLVALDGGALAAINAELLLQQQLRQRGSLNLQRRLREALQAIALQIPESYRRQLLAVRRHAAGERIRIVREVLGRHEKTRPTPAELRLEDIPTRLDLARLDEILHLSGDWPARFLEKFLLAGGLAVEPTQMLTAPPAADASDDDTAMQLQQMRMAVAMAQQEMDESGEDAQLVTQAILQAPAAAVRRIDGGFYLQWQELTRQLYTDPRVQANTVAVTRRGLIGRVDPAALDWALTTVRAALADTIEGAEPAAEELWETRQGAAGSAVGLAIDMLGQGGRPADLTLLRDLAFRPETPWRSAALSALRLHWTDADLPRLEKWIRQANRSRDYHELQQTALALENPRLDAAVAARADWFGSDNLRWQLQQYVLQRGTPELIAAAFQAWSTEDTLDPSAQAVAMAFRQTEYYPRILRSIYSPSNQRLNYDASLSAAYYLLQQDPEAVKPWLYALDDVLAVGKKEYEENPRYDKALFDELQETFKDATNVNSVYMRTRIVAEARLLLVIAGDASAEKLVSKALQTKIDSQGLSRRDFSQLTLMWYCRLLPQYPLPQLQTWLDKVDQRYYGGRIENQRQVLDPEQVRMELAGRFNQNQAFWFNRQRMGVRFNRHSGESPEAIADLPPPPLNYSYEPRVQMALQYHVPELALAVLKEHPEAFRDNAGLRMSTASTVGEVCAYAQAVRLYEGFLVDLPGTPPRVAMRDDNDGGLHSVCNNLSWLYATALDPKWRLADRSVMLAEESVRLQPGMSYSIDTRAYAYLIAGRYQEALADFEASARLLGFGDSAGLASSLARQARALHGLQRDDEALKRLEQACNLRPTDSDTLMWIARGYGLLGRDDRALQLLAQAEAAGFMYHEMVEHCDDFADIRHQRLYRNVLDNMRRHRKLIREIVLEYTPVSQVPEAIDAGDPGPAQEDLVREMRMRGAMSP